MASMKQLLVAGLALALSAPVYAATDSVFNGTWELEPTTLQTSGSKPIILSLKNGIFRGTEDGPPIKLRADGKDHPVPSHISFNTVAIDILNDHTVKEIDENHGKVVITALMTAAPDGRTLNVRMSMGAGKVEKQTFARVAPGAPGSNAISGAWQFGNTSVAATSAAANMFDTTFDITGNTVTSSNPEQAGKADVFTATVGGRPVPYLRHGRPSGTVSVKLLARNTLRETYYGTNGKVLVTATYTVLPGNQTMKESVRHSDGETITVTYRKQ